MWGVALHLHVENIARQHRVTKMGCFIPYNWFIPAFCPWRVCNKMGKWAIMFFWLMPLFLQFFIQPLDLCRLFGVLDFIFYFFFSFLFCLFFVFVLFCFVLFCIFLLLFVCFLFVCLFLFCFVIVRSSCCIVCVCKDAF